MPRRQQKRRQRPRRNRKPKQTKLLNSFSGKVLLAVRGDPFPLHVNKQLRYAQAFTLTCGAAGVFGTEQVFRLNSLYDPDLTGTGHQPYGFDTLTSIYQNYKVNSVTVAIKASDPSADGIQLAAMFQCWGTTYTVTGQSPNEAMEKPGMFIRDINNTGSQVVNFKQHFPMWQLCGVTRSQFSNDIVQFAAAYNTSPVATPYLRIATAALDASSTPTLRVQVELIFNTQFYGRTTLAQS